MTGIWELGEKRLIAEIIRPLFNPSDSPSGPGDDCADFPVPPHCDIVVSTDRVPADLIAFRLGILDYRGLGDYLARLNLSDVAAAGGRPLGLLLNAGLPSDFELSAFEALCRGFGDAAGRANCKVLGGDLSASQEISLSATSIGYVPSGQALRRNGAAPGDRVVVNRPLGLTPAAFVAFLEEPQGLHLSAADRDTLARQFTSLEPCLDLGQRLLESGDCTACMDNTDGIGQSCSELAAASGVAIVLDAERLEIPDIVARAAASTGRSATELALSAGADFSLVTCVRERDGGVANGLESNLLRIGQVEAGAGLWLESAEGRHQVAPAGWDYFVR